MRLAFLRTAAYVFLFPLFTFAQTSIPTQPAPVRDPQAVALLNQCSQAMGTPSAALSIELTGQITASRHSGEIGQIVLKQQGYGQMRNEQTYNSGAEISVVSNSQMQAVQGPVAIRIAPWAATYFRPDFLPALACSLDLSRPQMNVAYVGIEPVGQTQSHHIKFFASPQQVADGSYTLEPTISEFDVYLDTNTLTVVKTKVFAFSPDAIENHSDWETYFSDYRATAGTLMPFHIQHFLAGQLSEDIVVTAIQMNASLSSLDFSLTPSAN